MTDTAMWFMKAYQLVSRERILGMYAGNIPPSAMYEYSDRFGLIGTLEEFTSVICKMDDIYLKYASDKKTKEQNRTQNSQKRR